LSHASESHDELEQLRRENAQLRQQLSERQRAFEILKEGTRTGYWNWDLQDEELLLSPELLAMFGYAASELPAGFAAWEKLLHEEDLKLALRLRDQHIATQGQLPFRCNLRGTHREGHIVWIHCYGRVLQWTEDQQPRRMFGCFVDVSREQEQQHAFEQSFEQLHLILTNIEAGIWDINLTTGESLWADRLYEILGYDTNDIQPSRENFYRLVHPDDRERVQRAVMAHFERNTPYRVDFRLLRKDGRYNWVESQGACTRDHNGRPIRMTGAILDIQARKENELEIARNRYHLQEAARIACMGGWEFDVATQSLYWSPQVKRLHEVSEDYQPDVSTAIEFYLEEDRPKIRAAVGQCIEAAEPYDMELQLCTAQGRVFWARAKGEPVLDEGGNVIKMRGIFQDIEEEKRRELELQNTVEMVTSQNTRLNHFAHIVSHNLRAHTGNLNSLLELYQTEVDQNMKEELFGMFQTTSNELFETIEELSELVKVQSNAEQKRADIDLQDQLESTQAVLAGDMAQHHMKIEAFFHEPKLRFVPAYLESIFLNMLSNAIKYRSPERHPHVIIRSHPLPEGRTELSFTDNGIGIDLKRHGHKLFGLYETFHANPDAHGVGLFLVKSQVESQGGRVGVESEVGVGTTFTFVL